MEQHFSLFCKAQPGRSAVKALANGGRDAALKLWERREQGGIFPANSTPPNHGASKNPGPPGSVTIPRTTPCLWQGAQTPVPDLWSCNTSTRDTNQELRKQKLKCSGLRVPPAHNPEQPRADERILETLLPGEL